MKACRSRIDGAKLSRLREELALTIEQLAEETEIRAEVENKKGISAKTIGRLERGGYAQPYTLERVADALGVEPKELLVDGTSEESLLSKHLCDFSDYIEDRTKDFIGRGFVLDAIDEFVANNDCGYFFVKGDPGIGKSSVAASLIKKKKCVHHFNIRARSSGKVDLFLRNICSQLILTYELDYTSLPPEAVVDDRFLVELLDKVSAKVTPSKKAFIVVDALDEAEHKPTGGGNLLCLPPQLPKSVFVVATCRRQEFPLRIESPQDFVEIVHNAPANQEDIREYLKRRARQRKIKACLRERELTVDFFVETMLGKSDGNFMYLYYVLPEIVEGGYKDLELDKLPAGLQDYYRDHWRRMKMTAIPVPKTKMCVIYVLCELRKPIRRKLLAQCCGVDEIEVQQILDEWEQFLHKVPRENGLRYSLYHDHFAEFLHRKEVVQAARVSIKDINRLIARWLWGDLDDE